MYGPGLHQGEPSDSPQVSGNVCDSADEPNMGLVFLFFWLVLTVVLNLSALQLIKPRQGDINDHEPESVISVARLVARLRRTSSVSSEGSFQDDSDRRFVEGANQQLEAACYMKWDKTDKDSTDESEKTECVSIEDDEEKDNSGYDCPHILLVDMGEGDMAFGYKE